MEVYVVTYSFQHALSTHNGLSNHEDVHIPTTPFLLQALMRAR